jgi:hypothetical protein
MHRYRKLTFGLIFAAMPVIPRTQCYDVDMPNGTGGAARGLPVKHAAADEFHTFAHGERRGIVAAAAFNSFLPRVPRKGIYRKGQTHREVGTQSFRSNESGQRGYRIRCFELLPFSS